MACKGICDKYKAKKPAGAGRYANGQRRCRTCDIFIKCDNIHCPCCGYRLRTHPRNRKAKEKCRGLRM